MPISKNENYSGWEHEIFEHVQNFRTGLPRLHTKRILFESIVIVIVIARMD